MVNSFENFKRALGFWPYLKMWTCYWATSTLKLICLIKKKKNKETTISSPALESNSLIWLYQKTILITQLVDLMSLMILILKWVEK